VPDVVADVAHEVAVDDPINETPSPGQDRL
jgi:hypothetical protein